MPVADPTFSRASVAYKQDGTQVASGVPRYEAGKFGQAIMIEEGTTNLLTANQSSIETDASGWENAYNASPSRTTVQKRVGAAALAITSSANDQMIVATTGWTAGTNRFSVTAGQPYTASAYLLSSVVRSACWMRIDWYDSAGTFVSSSVGGAVASSATDWTRLIGTFTAPTGAASAHVLARVGGTPQPAVGEVHYVDGIQLENKAYATSWQIGGTARGAEKLTILNLLSLLPPAGGTGALWINPELNEAQMPSPFTGTFITIGDYSGDGSITLRARKNGQVTLGFLTQGSTSAPLWTDTSAIVPAGGGWPPAGWAHVAVTISGNNTVKAYVDGVLKKTVTLSNSITSWAGNKLSLEAEAGAGVSYLIDDLAIENVALSDAEILSLYNSGAPYKVKP